MNKSNASLLRFRKALITIGALLTLVIFYQNAGVQSPTMSSNVLNQQALQLRFDYLDEKIGDAAMIDGFKQLASDYGVPINRLSEIDLNARKVDVAVGSNPAQLFDLLKSNDPLAVAYGSNLLKGADVNASYTTGITNYSRVANLPWADGLTIRPNNSGGLGMFFEGQLDGKTVIFKANADAGVSIRPDFQSLNDLREYGGPETYGLFKVVGPDGLVRDAIAMERIEGTSLMSALRDLRSGKTLDFPITDKHVAAYDSILGRLAVNDLQLTDANLGDFLLTSDPNRPIVPIDMGLAPGHRVPTAVASASEQYSPIRNYLIEASDKSWFGAELSSSLKPGFEFGAGFKSATFLLGFSSGLDSIAGTQIFFDQLGLATNDYQRVNIAANFLGSASANLFVGSSTAAAVEGAVTLGWIGAGAAVAGGALFGSAVLALDYYSDQAAFGDKVDTATRGLRNLGLVFDRMTDSFSPPPLQFSNSGGSQVGALGATIKTYIDIAGGQTYDQATKDSPVFQDIVSAREAGSRINELLSRESLTPENLKLADDSLSEFETRLHRISLQADKDPKSVPKSFDVYAERRFLVAAKIGRKEFVNGKIVKTNRSKDGPSPRSPYQVAKAPARGTPAQIGGGLGGLTPGGSTVIGNTAIDSVLGNVNATGLLGAGPITFTPPPPPFTPDSGATAFPCPSCTELPSPGVQIPPF